MFRKGNPAAVGKPSATASVRKNGGWFGGGACPDVPRDPDVITEQDLEAYTAALTRNGFFGPNAWYMNHKANGRYSKQARSPKLSMPVLFLHGAYDTTCETMNSRFAEPMRGDCSDLTEVVVKSGHWMAQEQPVAVNAALAQMAGGEAARLLECGMTFPVTEHTLKTERHTTGYLACGPESGPLLIFCHGWPELSLSWRHQLPAMAALGFRCIAPDMRGYGRSNTYTRHEDFAQELIVQDMMELLASLGRDKAVWIGHDWGSPVVWNIAAHHADKTAGVASLCVPYLADGLHARHGGAAGRPQDLSRGRVPGRAVGLPVLLRGELRQGLQGLRGQHPQHGEGAVPQGRSQVGRQAEPHGLGAQERRLGRAGRLSRRAARSPT